METGQLSAPGQARLLAQGDHYRLCLVKQHFAVRDLDRVWDPALLAEYEESE